MLPSTRSCWGPARGVVVKTCLFASNLSETAYNLSIYEENFITSVYIHFNFPLLNPLKRSGKYLSHLPGKV
jgi:hypothetical protein